MSKADKLRAGEKAPDFCLPDKDGNKVCLKEYAGKWVVLYFYPRDNTPGCTIEAKGFTDARKEFEKHNAYILGVSNDSKESHCKFADKHGLSFTLLSDEENEVLDRYGAWKPKKMAGKEFMGSIRSTFLIDPEGKIARTWPKVQVHGHVKEVLDAVKELEG